VIIASTPWGEAGLLYRLWKEKPEGTLVAHAPTLLLNDSVETREAVTQSEAQDPDNARREFGAAFMTSGTTVFFEATSIDAACTTDAFVAQPGDVIAAGADFGFRSDSSALVLVALRGGRVHVFAGAEERPDGVSPLKPSVTVARFADVMRGKCSYLMADQHYREAIAEHLETHSVVYVPAPMRPADSYVRARMLLREGKVTIHTLPFLDRLLQQMREVHGRPTSGGGMSIVHPRWASGGHGDIVSALVLALWQVSGEEVRGPEESRENLEKMARAKHYLEERERPYWKQAGDTPGNWMTRWRQ
jgi:hypothetical protein